MYPPTKLCTDLGGVLVLAETIRVRGLSCVLRSLGQSAFGVRCSFPPASGSSSEDSDAWLHWFVHWVATRQAVLELASFRTYACSGEHWPRCRE